MPTQKNKANAIFTIIFVAVIVFPAFNNAEKIVVNPSTQSYQAGIEFYDLDIKSEASTAVTGLNKETKETVNNFEKRFVDFSKMDMPKLSKNERRVYEVCQSLGIKDNAQLANVLAQVNIESSFAPKKEYKAGPRDKLELIQQQSTYWYTGYMGRGLIQLTWKNNYQKMGDIFKVDLINNPDLLITDFDLSAKVACLGMKEGLFTTIKLDHFINSKVIDYREARRIVNGDKNIFKKVFNMTVGEKTHELSQDYYNKIITSKPY